MERPTFSFSQKYFLLLAISVVMRLAFMGDMEWKYDEKWMFQHAQLWANQGIWPSIGVLSGAGLPNTGFSTWPFIVMAHCHLGPVGMATTITLLNLLALWLFYHALKQWKPAWQEGIQWGILLALTHVMAFTFSRKIWAQDLLPVFTALAFWGWVNRHRIAGSITMALGLGLACQLHISGFYLTTSLVLSTLWYDGWRKSLGWLWAFSVTLIGSFSISFQWIQFILTHPTDTVSSSRHWYKFEYFLRILTDTAGVNVNYSLGKNTVEVIQYPLVGGLPTYVMGCLLLIVTAYFLRSLYFGVTQTFRGKVSKDAQFLVIAYGLIPALLYTLSSIPVRNHYLIVVFPMMQIVFGIWLWKHRRQWLKIIVIAQLLISAIFAGYIHVKPSIDGDYGKPYSHQSLQEQQEKVAETPKKD